jgi:adenosylcobyric acid synthase
LLDPAPADLEGRTGVPTVGVLPWMAHALPDEEGPTEHFAAGRSVGLVCGPYASNLDEFVALQQVARVDLVRRPEDLRGVELVILPGSKHVAADLAWMRGVGLVDAVVDAVSRGIGVLGICGGLQLLGRRIEDPHGVEGAAAGLGLLDVDTTLARDKHTARTHALVPPMPSPWEWLGATSVDGYEIRHGRTTAHAASTAVVAGDTLFIKGNVAGTTLHGLFENRDIVERFAGRAPATLDAAFDALADAVDRHFDTSWLEMRTSR